MKKLALALVCLVSVAFFASCDKKVEHPEPQIAVLGEGYLQDGDVVECGVEYAYGFRVASNFETQKELSKFVVTCTSGEYVSTLCDSVISGTEFVYEDWVYFEPSKDIIGSVELTAVVTDVDGYTNTATLKIDINKEEDLAVSDLSWVRRGANVSEATEQEMAIMGLQWTGSYKDIMATIKPLNDNCKLYALIDSDVFETINTESLGLCSKSESGRKDQQ